MSYTIDRLITGATLDEVDARARAAMAAIGFGVLTEIDMKATLKEKIGAEIPPYRILGACNPQMAHQAIGMEQRVGVMLPCNVILRAVDGGVAVSTIDPTVTMQVIDNEGLHALAAQGRDLLVRAFAAI